MKASELIERLAHHIMEEGDREIYIWNNLLMKHVPIENTYIVDNKLYNANLGVNDEDYDEDFHNIYHNIVIN